jgi:carbonic anhydrase
MSRCAFGISLMVIFLCFLAGPIQAATGACAAADPAEMQHSHTGDSTQHHMDVPEQVGGKCDPKYTYAEGPLGPDHWEGVCRTGAMQAPVDIQNAEKLNLAPMIFGYQPSEFALVNDCNHYEIKVKFPSNFWLRIGKKPYYLTELHFHEPGENAVKGVRPVMAIHLVHLSPESQFLVIEVPVVVGKENPAIKTLWERIPEKGQQVKPAGVKFNAADLLPADRDYYRFPGSLTIPICNEGVTWFLLKKPIEMSQAQIDEYRKYYHGTARPLQPLNNRPVAEPK